MMGIREKFERFKQDWAASSEALEANLAAGARRRAREQEARRAAGGCGTDNCPRSAERDGYCRPCWSAIFGGGA
ncbi:hypothetical protein [Prauserella cavernicola]|uniref:Uncharacterized protein n=1 Tax=Prauserella cavernicola TaxID=2800127 RepID=A0A934QR25_9PSEU|nr:hypothetical protein [Prauserella cavernicola]MBK1784548.1 hypothetical protein [Prauserella cavernicola]